MTVTSYAIALGSNRRHGRHGSPENVLRAAKAALEAAGLRVTATSPVIRTEAMGPAGRGFANAAMLVDSTLAPPALLALLKATERAFGRRRRGRRWGARVLDLDILLWSGGAFHASGLSVPHRELARRAFVLRPLATVAGGWRLPGSVLTVRHLLARLQAPHPVDPQRPRP
ncbi:2-amino-4-hydroxy-6-hydroxymethyldihydropteridine diphosphokinase [Sphingomonas sp. ID0503]|uniref:2-amino-4-hydroxy-6- hydroxymethyldihydropteridine diphosphokinase n=1 Tax=Sphingomonas sp. ID0503 TaxID=3399691 RepID=UPI003AFA0EEE